MTGFVKSIAPKQMVGVGDEGFATFINGADPESIIKTNPGACLYVTVKFSRSSSACQQVVIGWQLMRSRRLTMGACFHGDDPCHWCILSPARICSPPGGQAL